MAESKETMDQQTIDELKRTYSSSGPSGLLCKLKDKLNHWKSQSLNIAIIGESGTGKSSYINAIRELDGDDEGAAAVGETETTIGDPVSYKDPRNSNLLYWDLPGVGAPKYPKETYLRQVGFDKFDFCILIYCQRFTENDLWLAKEIEKAGKKFFFLRSKIDNALNDEKRGHKRTYNKEATLDKIRKDCIDSLREGGIFTVNVFLISSYEPALFDFKKAKETLLQEFPQLKKDALVLSVPHGQSKWILKRKLEVLRERIEKVCLVSCLSNAVPKPELSLVCDIKFIHREADFYANQLALDDSSLENLARVADVTDNSLKEKRRLYCEDEIATKLMKRKCGADLYANQLPLDDSSIENQARDADVTEYSPKDKKPCEDEISTKLMEKKGKVRTYLSFKPFAGTIANLDAASIALEILNDIVNNYEEAAANILEYTQPLIAKKAEDEMDL